MTDLQVRTPSSPPLGNVNDRDPEDPQGFVTNPVPFCKFLENLQISASSAVLTPPIHPGNVARTVLRPSGVNTCIYLHYSSKYTEFQQISGKITMILSYSSKIAPST